MNRPHIDDDWPCLQFARLDCSDPYVVGAYLELLFLGHRRVCSDASKTGWLEIEEWPSDPPWRKQETGWWSGVMSPVARMGKLLWEMLNPDNEFSQGCVWAWHHLVEDSQKCAEFLPPIQAKLVEVLGSFADSSKLSSSTGQADWGETFYFEGDLRDYVREQLKRSSLQLLDQESQFVECSEFELKYLVRDTIEFLPPILADDDRVYIGEWECGEHWSSSFIWVVSSSSREPLRSTNAPYGGIEALTWGYFGHGSYTSAESILTDATGGNLALAKTYARRFLEDILVGFPQHGRLELSRVEVLKWLEAQGRTLKDIERSTQRFEAASVASRPKLERLIGISKEPLKEQRFDIVPTDFEASLYVDLYRMIQSDGLVMRCAECDLPLGYSRSTRGNQQRARWKKGLAIYHPECLEKSRKDQKRVDSRERQRRKRLAAKQGVKVEI